MNLIGEFTRRLDLEIAPFFNWALHHRTIGLVTLLLLLGWAGRRRRTPKHV
jgi:hypothetical protein